MRAFFALVNAGLKKWVRYRTESRRPGDELETEHYLKSVANTFTQSVILSEPANASGAFLAQSGG